MAAAPSPLQRVDFDHLPVGVELLLATLCEAQTNRRPGTNVLLHGAPGNGKTQLGRLLAQVLEASAFEVPLVDANGDARNGDSRVESLGGWLSTEDLFRRDYIVFNRCREIGLPVAWNLAGGYQTPLRKVLDIHDNTLRAAKIVWSR